MTGEDMRSNGITTHVGESVGRGSAGVSAGPAVELVTTVAGAAEDLTESLDGPTGVTVIVCAVVTAAASGTAPSTCTSSIALADSDVTGFDTLATVCEPDPDDTTAP
jgi:hypothetical protein